MAFELGRSLLLADAIAPDALAHALFMSASKRVALPRALLEMGAIEPERLDEQLARVEAPIIRHVVPLPELVNLLPPGLCEALLAVPLRRDPRMGTVDVAVVDVRDPHPLDEMSYWLDAPIRVVRASFASMDAALKRLAGGPISSSDSSRRGLGPPRAPMRTPMYGTPAYQPEPSVPAKSGDRVEVFDFPVATVNIPIPLTRRNSTPPAGPGTATRMMGLGAKEFPTLDETLPDPEPVLELRQVKRTPLASEKQATAMTRPEPPAESEPLSRAPVTTRGPFAPNAPTAPFEDIAPFIVAIAGENDRDAVLDLLVAGMRTVARKVAILVVKRDGFYGLTCSPELGEKAAIRDVRVALEAETLLAQAVGAPDAILGRLTKMDAYAPLLALLKTAPNEVATVAVRIDGRPTLVLFADELGDALVATRRMGELARAAGDALGRILRAKRQV